MRLTKRHIGRTRHRLAALLTAALEKEGLEVVVDPAHLRPAQGRWRSDYRMDVMRWEGSVEVKNPPDWSNPYRTVAVGSWSTMSDCIRGLKIEWETNYRLDVWATTDRAHPASLSRRPSGPQRSEVSPQSPDSPLNPSETNHG